MPSGLAEALYQAHHSRTSGVLKLLAGGRLSELLLHGGDLVGAQIGFGARTLGQSLLMAGRIGPPQLDMLWARGEAGNPDPETLAELGIPFEEAVLLRHLAHVRSLAALTQQVVFDRALAPPAFAPIPGTWIVRAAVEAEPRTPPRGFFRCLDPARCEPWLRTDEERQFISRSADYLPTDQLAPAQVSLLAILAREGLAELLTEQAYHDRLRQQQAPPPPPEPPPAAPPGPEAEASWADLLEPVAAAPELSGAGPAPDGGGMSDLLEPVAVGSPTPAPEVSFEPVKPVPGPAWSYGAPPPPEDEQGSMGQALRQASAQAAEPIELEPMEISDAAAPPAPPLPPAPPPESLSRPTPAPIPSTVPANMVPPGWGAGPPGALRKPLVLGPQAKAEPEDDLWQLVSPDAGTPAQGTDGANFEEALKQVDAHLEQLVSPAAPGPAEPPVEAIVESTFDPGAASGAAQAPVLEDQEVPGESAEAARQRRQRLLQLAMSNLGALAPPPPPAAREEALQPTSGEEAELAARIEQKYAQVAGKADHFTLLEVPAQASKNQIKSAFLAAAKQYHPDRLPVSLKGLTPKITAVFEAVREAYEVLYDDTKRQAYVLAEAQRTSPEGRAREKAAQAQEHFKRAEALMRRRDFVSAEAAYSQAYAVDPKAVYLAAQGWALYMDPTRKVELQRARDLMIQALRADPKCDRAHYQLGVIARVEGKLELAERHFRDAVAANPKHLEANQELRLIDMRRKKPEGR